MEGETPQLPDNYAQMVLQLEMQMEFEESSTLNVVQELNQLYRIAIQHYIDCQDERRLRHFQRKLQMLLTHPRTLQAIENTTEKVKGGQGRKVTSYNSTLNSQINKFNSESNVLVKSMMEGSQIRLERTNRLVNQNIEGQQEVLKRRMESRGKSRIKTEKIR